GVSRYQGLHRSLVEMLRETVERVPDNEALVELGGDRVSYRALWDRSARVAGGLKAQGVARGDRVAIRLGNCANWCIAFFGVQMAGAIAVPVNTRFSESEVEYVIDDSGSSYVFMPGDPLPDDQPIVYEGLKQDDTAAIFYTSGTTGFAKGAMTTHQNFLSNAETCFRINNLPREGAFPSLVSVPLFHVTGCNSQFLPTCQGGGATVIMPVFEVQAFLRAIVEERTNMLASVPAIYWLAINQPNFRTYDVSGVSWLAYGGAPIAP